MARTKISEFSSTAADNTDIDGIDIAEGCAPSGINNAIRTLMADLKDMQTGASGDTFTFASLNATTANIDGGTIDGATIGGSSAAPVSSTNLAYTGTLTGGTGVINIGSGQIYKDASGNVGIGTSSPGYRLDVVSADTSAGYSARFRSNATATQTVLQFTDNGATFETARIAASDSSALTFGTAGSERMRIDNGGNVGIGTVTPAARLDVVADANAYAMKIRGRVADNASILQFVNNANSVQLGYIQVDTNSNVMFGNNGGERMRIDSSGNLLVGTTSQYDVNRLTIAVANNGIGITGNNGSTAYTANGTGNYNFGLMRISGTEYGSITVTTGGTAYNTSSDYRLKNIDGELTNSGEFIDALRPVYGTWKADGSTFIGLIAHEVDAISQTKVATGTKDEVDADGNPVYQGMDYSSAELIANLIAEVKSLRKRVAQLEGA